MKNKSIKELIDELIEKHKLMTQKVEDEILPLHTEQKSWKPSSDRWSVLECFAHLNKQYNFYIKSIRKRIEKKSGPEPSEFFTSSHIGRTLYRSVKLNKANKPKRRLKSIRAHNPKFNGKIVKGNDVKLFIENQKQMLELLKEVHLLNLKKVKVPLAVSKVVKVRLGDALLIIQNHNERHIQQALNVIDHPKFPKK